MKLLLCSIIALASLAITAAPASAQEEVAPVRLASDAAEFGSYNQLDPATNFFFGGGGFTETSFKSEALFMLIFWFGVFWFVLLMGLMLYWTWKYRRRPGRAAPVSASHNTLLEVVWTVVPSSALIVLFLLGFWTYMEKQVSPADAMELRVEGYKWGWDITYPNGGSPIEQIQISPGDTVLSPVIVLPENTPVSLRMKSRDVIHSFWIPDLRVKMDMYPNRYTGFTFTTPELSPNPNNPGAAYQDHWVFCAEYCGDRHSQMAAIIRVVSAADYQQFLIDSNTDGLTPIELGKLVASQKCYICHSIDGSGNTGPTWLNMYGYEHQYTDGSTVLSDMNHLRESIIYPNAKVRAGYAGAMPAFPDLEERQYEGLLQYMRSLSDRGQAAMAAESVTDEAAADEGNAEDGEADDASEADADPDDSAPAEQAVPAEDTPAPQEAMR